MKVGKYIPVYTFQPVNRLRVIEGVRRQDGTVSCIKEGKQGRLGSGSLRNKEHKLSNSLSPQPQRNTLIKGHRGTTTGKKVSLDEVNRMIRKKRDITH